MEIIKVIILGIIQGVTEFLPISSSGHLAISQYILGIDTDQLTLTVVLHFGTVIPVILIYWEDVKGILSFKKEKRRLSWLILVAIIPTGIIGFLFEDYIEGIFSSVLTVGIMLLITGLLIFLTERLSRVKFNLDDMKEHNALIVGIAQGLAIIPGISRSGSTIVSSLLQGLDRESAARFSFLVSVPVIAGVGLLELKDVLTVGLVELSWISLLVGFMVSAVSGYFAIKYLLHVLKRGSLVIFAYYCWGIGLIVIFSVLAGIL
ncbi:MAG: undecaprenyl-diphosphatase UppP [bacterium]